MGAEKSRFAFTKTSFMSFLTMDEVNSIVITSTQAERGGNTVPTHELCEPNWMQNYLGFVEGVVAG